MPTSITIADVTDGTINGGGIFDKLMNTVSVHVAAEYSSGRIKGQDYANVYLAAMQASLTTAANLTITMQKAAAETDMVIAQAALTTQQTANLVAEALNIPKQGSLLDTQISVGEQNVLNAAQQLANAVIEATVLLAQECKLSAEFDVLMQQVLKVIAETSLTNQRKLTEQAQITGTGIDTTSVLGKQIELYGAQTSGFARDAEQKAAKLFFDTWNTRRLTDTTEPGSAFNGLDDANILRSANKILAGIGA